MSQSKWGPTALIVGGSTGIGAVLAVELAKMGIDLVLVGRSSQRLEAAKALIGAQASVIVRTLACDIASAGAVEQLIAFASREEVGLLAYIAGTVPAGGFFVNDLSAASATVQLNALAPMQLIHHFGGAMRERRRGAILLTSSLAGLAGSANLAAYSASKAFGQLLMESIWAELRTYNVDVLSLIVYATQTVGAARVGAQLENVTGRRVMSPDEVAHIALQNLGNGPTWWAGEENFAQADQFCTKNRRRATEVLSARFARLWEPRAAGSSG